MMYLSFHDLHTCFSYPYPDLNPSFVCPSFRLFLCALFYVSPFYYFCLCAVPSRISSVCVCVLFTMVWRITHCTRDCQPLPPSKELRAHRNGSMGKVEISHTSLSVKNPSRPERGSDPCLIGWNAGMLTTDPRERVCVCVCVVQSFKQISFCYFFLSP